MASPATPTATASPVAPPSATVPWTFLPTCPGRQHAPYKTFLNQSASTITVYVGKDRHAFVILKCQAAAASGYIRAALEGNGESPPSLDSVVTCSRLRDNASAHGHAGICFMRDQAEGSWLTRAHRELAGDSRPYIRARRRQPRALRNLHALDSHERPRLRCIERTNRPGTSA